MSSTSEVANTSEYPPMSTTPWKKLRSLRNRFDACSVESSSEHGSARISPSSLFAAWQMNIFKLRKKIGFHLLKIAIILPKLFLELGCDYLACESLSKPSHCLTTVSTGASSVALRTPSLRMSFTLGIVMFCVSNAPSCRKGV